MGFKFKIKKAPAKVEEPELMEIASEEEESYKPVERPEKPEKEVRRKALVRTLTLDELVDDTVYAVRHHHIHHFGTHYAPIMGSEIRQRNVRMFEYAAVETCPGLPQRHGDFIIHVGSERYISAHLHNGPYIPIHVYSRRPKLKSNGTFIPAIKIDKGATQKSGKMRFTKPTQGKFKF